MATFSANALMAMRAAKRNVDLDTALGSIDYSNFVVTPPECSHYSLQPSGRPMKTLARVNVFDLYEAT